jgi:hypothetical protein
MSAAIERSPLNGALATRLGLIDAVDHLLNRGAVVVGEATISLGGVELVYLGLNVLLSSVETLQEVDRRGDEPTPLLRLTAPTAVNQEAPRSPAPIEIFPPSAPAEPESAGEATAASSDDPSRSLAQLVLTLVELLRQVLERQAVRRMEGGSLADAEVERMGTALLELESKLAELRRIFDLKPEDLNIDLGPLGQLL